LQSIFSFIIHPMEIGLAWLAINVGSAGIGIVLFTIGIRLILSPLQIVQLRNAKAMQRLQPLMAEMKQKHGKDREALSKATMALYKEHNVNPAMGCLPMLLQFPVLIGLFYGLMALGSTPAGYPLHIVWSHITCSGHPVTGMSQWMHSCYAISGIGQTQHVFNLFHANFLWLSKGLGEPDPLYILPLLAGATQWVQSRMMLTKSNDPQQQTMNFMMNFMPLMIIFFATRYASGLSLYWVTSTLIGIAIQYRITGLGLLTETWPFSGLAIPHAGTRSSGGGSAQQQRPVTRSVPAGGLALTASDGAGEDEVTPNGGSNNRTNGAARPRKKANRAKGGRSGGRRG